MILVGNSLVDGKKLAQKIKSRFCFVSERAYPDSEKNLIVKGSFVKADIIYFKFNTIDSFDDQLFNLLCLLNRSADRRQTNLILPYLPYLRSTPSPKNEVDKISFILDKITEQVKKIYLIYPHVDIEQIKKRKKLNNLFIINIDNQIIKYLKILGRNLILVSPDDGFSKNIIRLSQKSGFDYVVLDKKRISAIQVAARADNRTRNKIICGKDKEFVIIDDIVSTGGTLTKASEYLKSCGAKKIKFISVHDTRKNNGKKLDIYCSNSLMQAQGKTQETFQIENSVAEFFKK